MESQAEFRLTGPEDAISAVKFGPQGNQFLLASSWDGFLRLYDTTTQSLKQKYPHESPILDCCFSDPAHAFSGGLDRTLKSFDLNTASESVIGSHNHAIRCIEMNTEVNGILTGSWDHNLKLWDPRVRASGACCGTYNQGDKVFTLSVCGEKVLVGTAGRKILVWDIRNMAYTLQKRDSNLKFQTRAIRCFPNKFGFAVSSIEGRVAVEYFDTNPEVQKKKYAFKCHRIKDGDLEKVFPVNAISFHPTYNTFATGGSDGFVNIWDGFNKKRLCQFRQYHTSVTSLNFSSNGSTLAIACSYFLGEDDLPNPMPEDVIFIRTVSDQETKPKYSSA